MPYNPPDSTELEEIEELNLLFLIYLRAAARAGGDCLGLPARSARTLRELSSTRGRISAIVVHPRFEQPDDDPRTSGPIPECSGPKPAGTHAGRTSQRMEHESSTRFSGPHVPQALRGRDPPTAHRRALGVTALGRHAELVELCVPRRSKPVGNADQPDRD